MLSSMKTFSPSNIKILLNQYKRRTNLPISLFFLSQPPLYLVLHPSRFFKILLLPCPKVPSHQHPLPLLIHHLISICQNPCNPQLLAIFLNITNATLPIDWELKAKSNPVSFSYILFLHWTHKLYAALQFPH